MPGVSGGTIAFIAGIYERLIHAISQFRHLLGILWHILRGGIRKTGLAALCRNFYRQVDMTFLLLLFGAMLVSILSLARGISYLLAHHPVLIWAFFFGLVLVSINLIARTLNKSATATYIGMAVGAIIGLIFNIILPFSLEPSPLALFIGGAFAVCAWILPGVSGSYLLLILGLYPSVIAAITELDLSVLLYLGLGCLLGLAIFSQLLNLLLARLYNATIATLTGFVIGSLPVLWPWKHISSHQLLDDGSRVPLVVKSVLPGNYETLTGEAPILIPALLAALAGAAIVLLLNRFSLLSESRKAQGERAQSEVTQDEKP